MPAAKKLITLALFAGALAAIPATPSHTAGPGGTEYAKYLSEHENEILREHNLVRTDPAGYVQYLEEWRDYYRGRRRFLPGRRPVWTNEGVEAVEEAIRFLLVQDPVRGYSARELIIRLIIDDGIEDRGHRRNIFNPQYRQAGVSFGDHRSYRTMCVITYAAEFEEFADSR
jgi:hypothetical protein